MAGTTKLAFAATAWAPCELLAPLASLAIEVGHQIGAESSKASVNLCDARVTLGFRLRATAIHLVVKTRVVTVDGDDQAVFAKLDSIPDDLHGDTTGRQLWIYR